MNKKIPLKSIVDSLSNEKGISKEIIFDAIKEAILFATKKKYTMLNIETIIDQNTGIYKTFAIYKVIENIKNINPFQDIPLDQAKKYNKNIKIGDIIKKEIDSISFGRIDIQLAKQIILDRVKKAEKNSINIELQKYSNKIISGVIKKIDNEEIIISIGNNTNGYIKKKDLMLNDILKIGNKIKACIIDISTDRKELKLSRSCNDMLIELFKIEIPEIKSGLVEIKSVARDSGIRSKIAVKSNRNNIDPIGACLGTRGSRIQNIIRELNGEKIDLIKWDEDILKYIINIFYPIEIKSIEIDKNIKLINISIYKENLSKAIGKNGQNIKLITKLIKWNLNINECLNK